MNVKFVVRLQDANGDLLAWTETHAEARPQGRPRSTPFLASGPSMLVVERDGVAHHLTIHWPDLDVVRKSVLPETLAVSVGQVLRFDWIEPVWMVEGSKGDIPLPPVTVRAPVSVAVPVGNMGAETPV